MDISQTDDLDDTPRPSHLGELNQTMSEMIFFMLLTLRAKKNEPYTTLVEIINFLKDFTTTLFDQLATALNVTAASNVQNDLVHLAVSVLVDKLENAKSIFEAFKTEHNIQTLYAKHPMFVAPKTVVIGQRLKMPSVQMVWFGQQSSTSRLNTSCAKHDRYEISESTFSRYNIWKRKSPA